MLVKDKKQFKLVYLKHSVTELIKPELAKHTGHLNGFTILFPRKGINSEGVIVVPDERSVHINIKETKLVTIKDIFDMKESNQILDSDMFVYFLPNKNHTKIKIGSRTI